MGTAGRPGVVITDGGTEFDTDFHDEPPVQAIADALSDIEGRSADDIPPLYRYVDTDSMNRLMVRARDSNQDVTLRVRIDDYVITVDSDGTISITDHESDGASFDSE